MEGPVTLDLFVEPTSAIIVPGRADCELREETRGLLEDVASLSDQIALSVHDVQTEPDLAHEMGVTRVPTLVLRGAARGRVRYVGIPAGLEFGTLLEDLATVGSGTTRLGNESVQRLATLNKPVHVQVFVTPTCPVLPEGRKPGSSSRGGECQHHGGRHRDQRVSRPCRRIPRARSSDDRHQ